MYKNNNKDLNEYEDKLLKKLQDLLEEYQKRIEESKKSHHKHLSLKDTVTILGAGAAAGGAAGTVGMPGFGTAVGAAGGLVLAGAAILGNKAYDAYKDKKLYNATKVTNFLGDDQTNQLVILASAAHEVISEREHYLRRVHYKNDSNKAETQKNLVSYLAKNMMAAMKHAPQPSDNNADKTELVLEGLVETKSKKATSKKLELRNDNGIDADNTLETLTFKELTQNRYGR